MACICIINGHPDPQKEHFAHALAAAYHQGASETNHDIQVIDVAKLEFSWIQSKENCGHSDPPEHIQRAQTLLQRADHIVLIYPLWLGCMPALLKAFLEQVLRPGYAVEFLKGGRLCKKLKGRSVRVIITMSMPVIAYRIAYRSHSLKALNVGILKFCGMGPIRATLIGRIDSSSTCHKKWLKKVKNLGRKTK